jgi:hypothetical protein
MYSYNGYPVWNTVIFEDQSVQCVEIADEFAIGFAEWYFAKCYLSNSDMHRTTKELLKIYKKEKGL